MKIEINDKIINACKCNRPLLDMLCPKRSGRYTKLEAYIDLLDRMSQQKNDDVHTGEVVSVGRGEFAVTITELSEKWNWHRATVRSFLDALEELGEIRREIQKHCYKVSMVNHVRMFIPVDTPEDMLDYCKILFTHLTMRLRSMEELVPFAEQYCHLAGEAEEESGRAYPDDGDYIVRVVHALIVSSFSAIRNSGDIPLDGGIESAMLQTLRGDTPWSVQKWLEAACLVTMSLEAHAKPTLDMDVRGFFTEKDLPLLRRLYNHYMAASFGKSNPEGANPKR